MNYEEARKHADDIDDFCDRLAHRKTTGSDTGLGRAVLALLVIAGVLALIGYMS